MNKINKINVCCQKVLPLVYDESLSYYEVLCKVIQKLNELIKINNNIRDEIHKEYVEILETTKQVTEAVASVTSMRDEVLTLKQATEQYANNVVTVYNETAQARDTAIAKANIAEQSATTATEKANISQSSATTATEKADIAEQSANTATQKANSASQSATVATTKAREAQTSANNAKQYADEAKESASLVGQDVTQLKQDVNNLQYSVSKNTSNISSLTTKVNNNTSDISSLTTKVNNNTSDISSLTTKVDNNTSDISSLTTKVGNNTYQISSLHSTLAEYWKTLYPIGSIYISTNANFNPQTTWGGRWKRTAEGRCLIGANNTYPIGSIGGSTTHKHATKDHYLTTEEMPAHVHKFSKPAWTNGEYVAGQTYLCSYGWSSISTETFGSTNYTGGSKAHNHGDTEESSSLQPYLSVYIWERTA